MIKLISKRKDLKREQEFVRRQELERENLALHGRVEQLLGKCQMVPDTTCPEPRYQW